MNSREIAIKFKRFINSFDADPYEVAVCVASYLNQEGVDNTGSPRYIDIRLFDEDGEE